MSDITEKKVLPPFSQLMENVPRHDIDKHLPQVQSQLPQHLTQIQLSQYTSQYSGHNHKYQSPMPSNPSSSSIVSPKTVYHPNQNFHHLNSSHTHSKSLPIDPFRSHVSNGSTQPDMTSSYYIKHQRGESGLAYPYNYQFPANTSQNGMNQQVKQSVSAWDPENTMIAMTRMVPTFKEVVEGLGTVQCAFNNILINSLHHGSGTRQILVDGKKIDTNCVREQIVSIPLQTLNNLEFFLNLNTKFVRQLRNDQAHLLRENNPSSHSRSRSFPQTQNSFQYPPIPNFYPAHGSSNGVLGNPSFSAASSVGSSPGKRSKSSSQSPDRSGSSRKKRKTSKSERKLDSPIECKHCGSESTPEWRRGPEGEKTVCNACGIFYSKLIKKYETPAEAARIMSERKLAGLAMDRHV